MMYNDKQNYNKPKPTKRYQKNKPSLNQISGPSIYLLLMEQSINYKVLSPTHLIYPSQQPTSEFFKDIEPVFPYVRIMPFFHYTLFDVLGYGLLQGVLIISKRLGESYIEDVCKDISEVIHQSHMLGEYQQQLISCIKFLFNNLTTVKLYDYITEHSEVMVLLDKWIRRCAIMGHKIRLCNRLTSNIDSQVKQILDPIFVGDEETAKLVCKTVGINIVFVNLNTSIKSSNNSDFNDITVHLACLKNKYYLIYPKDSTPQSSRLISQPEVDDNFFINNRHHSVRVLDSFLPYQETTTMFKEERKMEKKVNHFQAISSHLEQTNYDDLPSIQCSLPKRNSEKKKPRPKPKVKESMFGLQSSLKEICQTAINSDKEVMTDTPVTTQQPVQTDITMQKGVFARQSNMHKNCQTGAPKVIEDPKMAVQCKLQPCARARCLCCEEYFEGDPSTRHCPDCKYCPGKRVHTYRFVDLNNRRSQLAPSTKLYNRQQSSPYKGRNSALYPKRTDKDSLDYLAKVSPSRNHIYPRHQSPNRTLTAATTISPPRHLSPYRLQSNRNLTTISPNSHHLHSNTIPVPVPVPVPVSMPVPVPVPVPVSVPVPVPVPIQITRAPPIIHIQKIQPIIISQPQSPSRRHVSKRSPSPISMSRTTQGTCRGYPSQRNFKESSVMGSEILKDKHCHSPERV